MKSLYKILLALIIIITFLFVFMNNQEDIRYSEEYEAIPPIPDRIKSTIKLYFVNENQLVEEYRTIITNDLEFEKAIMSELIMGPRNKLLEATLPSDTKIISIETIDRTCYINLSRSFIDTEDLSQLDSELAIWSIVNSLTELDYIQKVQILIEGKKIQITNSQIPLEEPLISNENLIKKKKITPFTVVTEFLDNVKKDRYDRAYIMLGQESANEISFKDFKNKMDIYLENLIAYEITLYNTQKFSDRMEVSIIYKLEDDQTQLPNEIIKHWVLIVEEGEWKIKLK